jgi:hypothetical protein
MKPGFHFPYNADRTATGDLACEQALWIELEPAGLVNKNTSVPITIYSVVNQM